MQSLCCNELYHSSGYKELGLYPEMITLIKWKYRHINVLGWLISKVCTTEPEERTQVAFSMESLSTCSLNICSITADMF